MGISVAVRKLPAQTSVALPARKFNLPVPGFLVLFVGLVGVHSAGWVPTGLQLSLGEGSRACLMVGVTALGMKTSLGGLAVHVVTVNHAAC